MPTSEELLDLANRCAAKLELDGALRHVPSFSDAEDQCEDEYEELLQAIHEDELFAQKTLAQLNAEMPLADVMFDYDQFTVRGDQRTVLQKNADYVRRWTSVRATVEGHADARGTREYNLALAQRRANAIRDYLVGLGIAADRLVVVSKGKEEPVCREDADACHAMNRRGHFIVTAK